MLQSRRLLSASLICKKTFILRRMESNQPVTLETLHFDNLVLKKLPIDLEKRNYVRTVNNACFSKISPTPLNNPELVCYSADALKLLDLTEEEIQRKEFVQYFSGNQILPGSETASHCYCGHQFGSFAGQLGDGAAIYLGEVVNKAKERWELQLKGAGLTPYSRTADGRKVLRSSIREFLCSEAMHHLGVPTTRAGSCIVSSDTVERDIFYTGNPKQEKCAVISRLAPTFLRFGSFEIFKTMDPETGRCGPSVGREDIMKQMLDYVVEEFFPDIAKEKTETTRYENMYKEVVVKTARLVALWQSVGFCHGVLNTDNMSILGLTIDYGPYGFLDRYDPDHICNSSDNGGRYSYKNQPEICEWNLKKFAEAIKPFLSLEVSERIRKEFYTKEFESVYLQKMRNKLGLLASLETDDGDILSDRNLIEQLFDTMEKTGADFTNTFRALSILSLPGLNDHQTTLDALKGRLLEQCSTLEEIRAGLEAQLSISNLQMFLLMLQINPDIQSESDEVQTIIKRLQLLDTVKKSSQEDKSAKDKSMWEAWLDKYVKRLQHDMKICKIDSFNMESEQLSRKKVMNANNPRFILRNYVAQRAIAKAEEGDYSEIWKVLKVLEKPYCDSLDTASIIKEVSTKPNVKPENISDDFEYDKKPAISACKLRVSCSS